MDLMKGQSLKLRFSIILFVFCLVWLNGTSSFAATYTWDGDQNDGNWNNPANWLENLVPTINDDVIIQAIQTGLYPVISSDIAIQSIQIEAGAKIEILANGILRIKGSTGTGLKNAGSFTNHGLIQIDSTASNGIHGLSGSEMINTGNINIGTNGAVNNIPKRGVELNGQARIDNNGGIIRVNNVKEYGLFVKGIINNNSNALIEIYEVKSSGIYVFNAGSFNNELGSILDIGKTSTHGIRSNQLTGVQEQQIQVMNLARGSYFLEIKVDETQISKSVILQ